MKYCIFYTHNLYPVFSLEVFHISLEKYWFLKLYKLGFHDLQGGHKLQKHMIFRISPDKCII